MIKRILNWLFGRKVAEKRDLIMHCDVGNAILDDDGNILFIPDTSGNEHHLFSGNDPCVFPSILEDHVHIDDSVLDEVEKQIGIRPELKNGLLAFDVALTGKQYEEVVEIVKRSLP